MGFPLYVTCCFSLTVFNIYYLFFVSLINMSWHVPPWVYPVWNSLHFFDLGDYFLSMLVRFSTITFSNIILFLPLLSPSPPPRPTYNSNTEMFHVVQWVSETVLFSFHSFSFILSHSRDFPHFVSQVTYLFFCLSHSFCY